MDHDIKAENIRIYHDVDNNKVYVKVDSADKSLVADLRKQEDVLRRTLAKQALTTRIIEKLLKLTRNLLTLGLFIFELYSIFDKDANVSVGMLCIHAAFTLLILATGSNNPLSDFGIPQILQFGVAGFIFLISCYSLSIPLSQIGAFNTFLYPALALIFTGAAFKLGDMADYFGIKAHHLTQCACQTFHYEVDSKNE